MPWSRKASQHSQAHRYSSLDCETRSCEAAKLLKSSISQARLCSNPAHNGSNLASRISLSKVRGKEVSWRLGRGTRAICTVNTSYSKKSRHKDPKQAFGKVHRQVPPSGSPRLAGCSECVICRNHTNNLASVPVSSLQWLAS